MAMSTLENTTPSANSTTVSIVLNSVSKVLNYKDEVSRTTLYLGERRCYFTHSTNASSMAASVRENVMVRPWNTEDATLHCRLNPTTILSPAQVPFITIECYIDFIPFYSFLC